MQINPVISHKVLKAILCAIFSLVILSSIQAQVPNGMEQLMEVDTNVFVFDYRIHRNPSIIFNNKFFQGKDSTFQYLYNGNVVAEYTNGKFSKHFTSHEYVLPPYKLDIQIEPLLLYSLGDYSDPVQSQIGISPKLMWVPAKGFYMVFQWQFPIQNDWQYVYGLSHRPGQIGLGFDHVIKGQHMFSGYVGTLTANNYGLNLEYLGRSKDARWYFGGAYFFTGSYIYHEQYFYRGFLNTASGYIQLAHRFPSIDLTVRWIGDVYLNQRRGMTLEVMRQYGNTDIGFYGIVTEGASSGGLFLRIPLWPRKFYSNDWMQVRFPHTFQNYYNVRTTSAMPRVRNYRSLFTEMMRFNPDFLNNQLRLKGE